MYCAICGSEINEVIVCDVVRINENYFYEEIVSPVLYSEKLNMRTGEIFDYDFYKKAVAKKHDCKPEDVTSKYVDDMEVTADVYAKLGKKDKDMGCRCPVCEDFV